MRRHVRQRNSAVGPPALAFGAAELPDVSVQFKYVLAPCEVVQSIHILSDKGELGLANFKLHQCSVAGIRLCFCKQLTTPVVPLPNELGITAERFRCRKVFRSKRPPQPSVSAKRGHAAFCGNASTSKNCHSFCGSNPLFGGCRTTLLRVEGHCLPPRSAVESPTPEGQGVMIWVRGDGVGYYAFVRARPET